MGWTKRQLIDEAFAELALAGYEFDITPDEMQAALRRLDTMMATWGNQSLHVGYMFGDSPDNSDIDQDSGLPLWAVEAAYLNLAARIAGSKGKSIASSTLQNAKFAFDALMSRVASDQLQEQQMPAGVPRGAGRKPWRTINQPFLRTPNTEPLQLGTDGGLDFTGKSN